MTGSDGGIIRRLGRVSRWRGKDTVKGTRERGQISGSRPAQLWRGAHGQAYNMLTTNQIISSVSFRSVVAQLTCNGLQGSVFHGVIRGRIRIQCQVGLMLEICAI